MIDCFWEVSGFEKIQGTCMGNWRLVQGVFGTFAISLSYRSLCGNKANQAGV